MSIWSRIATALQALARGEGLSQVFDHLRTPPERSVAFTIAVIGLGAKMAKADGQVTRNEVAAFRRVFHIPPSEEANAARVFNLARQDVAGFESYARKIANMFRSDQATLGDILEGLIYVAVADGNYHPSEDEFLRHVAEGFGISEQRFRALRKRHLPEAASDPYDVLEVPPDAPFAEVRAAWRRAVLDSHPDRMMARGAPSEAIRFAELRLAAVNAAWATITRERAA